MATTDSVLSQPGETHCTYHPNVATRLRCSRCGKPICPRCGVRTPVGLRCPDCAGVRGLPTYATTPATLARAAGAGLVVAFGVGVIWGYLPNWGFYLALALGFGVAEAMAHACNAKRGRDLQFLAVVIVAFGLAVSRYVLAQRIGVDLDQVNTMNENTAFDLRLQIVPDILFAALPFVIGWIRFR